MRIKRDGARGTGPRTRKRHGAGATPHDTRELRRSLRFQRGRQATSELQAIDPREQAMKT